MSVDASKLACAGGILFYDDNGFWVVTELRGLEVQYTDMGGRYCKDDIDVKGTIRREMYEESYGILDCTISDIKNMFRDCPSVILHSKEDYSRIVYVCLCVHSQNLSFLLTEKGYPATISNLKALYDKGRKEAIFKNPNEVYKGLSIEYILRKDLPLINLSHRLREVFDVLKVDYGKD